MWENLEMGVAFKIKGHRRLLMLESCAKTNCWRYSTGKAVSIEENGQMYQVIRLRRPDSNVIDPFSSIDAAYKQGKFMEFWVYFLKKLFLKNWPTWETCPREDALRY